MATISFVIPPAWCIYIFLYTSHCFILVPTCLNILGSVEGEGTNQIWHFKPMSASFCSNKPDVGWGRIEKKCWSPWSVDGSISNSFFLGDACSGFVVLFPCFFFTRLPCNQQRDARLLFSLSIHSSIIFLTLCDSFWFKFFSSILLFLFGLRWDIYLFLPFLQVVKAKKKVPFQLPLRCSMLGN